MMANRDLLQTFPCVFIAGLIVSYVTTPLISKSLDLRNDRKNQCSVHNRLKKLKVPPPEDCPDEEVMDLALYLIVIGFIFLFLVTFFLSVVWIVIMSSQKKQKAESEILIGFFVGTIGLVVFMAYCYITLDTIQGKNKEMNWKTLHTDMKSSLVDNFVSDNIRSENETSNQWNILFIEYKCCGVNTVFGTSNDFDTTPWCTTNGSCQQTNSQIPKSCCLGVILEDPQSPNDDCHASVTKKTYNEKGCFMAVKEELIEKRAQQILKIRGVLEEEIKLLAIMGVCVLLQVFGIIGITGGYTGSLCKIREEDEGDSEQANGSRTEEPTQLNGISVSRM